jgi:transcriptional regulator with XRE-family HTH domain
VYFRQAMTFTEQIKKRRLALGLKQSDMKMRVGMNQQQYQKLEAGGNPRLGTLELIAQGLEAELVLVPRDKVRAVRQLLQGSDAGEKTSAGSGEIADDPWEGMLDN